MFTFVLVIHVIVSILLALVILLQDGKGGDIVSALGGGGSQTLFGSTGAATFLTKATITLTVIFVLTSLGLAILKTREQRSVLDVVNPKVATEEPAAVTPETKAKDAAAEALSSSEAARPVTEAKTDSAQPKAETNTQKKANQPASSQTDVPEKDGGKK